MPIVTGIDRLASIAPRDALGGLGSARLGFITNDLALTSDIRRGREVLVGAGYDFRMLFGPEHGLNGQAREGEAQEDGIDAVTGVPSRSLFGDTLSPDPADLALVDVILYDLPDVGVRFYTYMWTLSYALEACAAAGKTLVVLDRPNPIGGLLSDAEGPWLDEEDCTSFVGRWRMPVRHSLTIGELATWWVKSRGIDVDLVVVPVSGWARTATAFDSLAHWTPPSPNLPSPINAVLYPGTCFIEGVNLAEGRSTPVPFRVLGAPWLDGDALAARIRELGIPGLQATPYGFIPLVRDYAGEQCNGVLFVVTDHRVLRPVSAITRVLAAIEELQPGMLVEAGHAGMPGEPPSTALEKLFGQRGAFEQITTGQWNDSSKFEVPDWAEAVGDSLLYRDAR